MGLIYGGLYCMNGKGRSLEINIAHSTYDGRPDAISSMSLRRIVSAVRNIRIYTTAILRAESKLHKWVCLGWVHLAYHLERNGT